MNLPKICRANGTQNDWITPQNSFIWEEYRRARLRSLFQLDYNQNYMNFKEQVTGRVEQL